MKEGTGEMKQRITVGQLNKLPDAHKEQLMEWWKPAEGDWVINDHHKEALLHEDRDTDWIMFGGYADVVKGEWGDDETIKEIKERCLPLLSIGQMVEFIQEKRTSLKGISVDRFGKWFVTIETVQHSRKDEICDALWEAMTRVLKTESA